MRILFFPPGWTVALCFVVWPILQVSAVLICSKIPDKVFTNKSFLFKTHVFEKEGRIYNSMFRVSGWKHLLPDGAAVSKKGYKKKRIKDFSEDNLRKFLIESARGELIHWLGIVPFWIFGFFTPGVVVLYMLVYALAVNLPCIIVQRYNRPRIQRLLERVKAR